MQVKSTVKINMSKIKQLTQAAVTALELTAESLHTEVIQAQVIPRDNGVLQGEKGLFVDYSWIIPNQAREKYLSYMKDPTQGGFTIILNTISGQMKILMQRGIGLKIGSQEEAKQNM